MNFRQCVICKKRFVDRQIDERGVCIHCLPAAVPEKAKLLAKAINDLMNDADLVVTTDEKLAIYGAIIRNAELLCAFEKDGENAIPGGASLVLDFHQKLAQNLVTSVIEHDIRAYMELIHSERELSDKIEALSNLRKQIIRRKKSAEEFNTPISTHLHHTLDKITLQELTYQGKKAAAAGQVEKALVLYKRALDQLLNDDIDDSLQEKEFAIVRGALKRLIG